MRETVADRIGFGPQDRLAALVAAAERLPRATEITPALELSARLCCALQRDRDRGWDPSEDADQVLEELGVELGRLGVFAVLGLLGEAPPADVRGAS